MLQSLQRRFLSQQTLQTPYPNGDSQHTDDDVGGGGGGGASDGSQQQQRQQEFGDLDGFILHSQPTYERVLSQKLHGDIDADGVIHEEEEEVEGLEKGEEEQEEGGELDTDRIGNVNATGDDIVLGEAADTTTTTTNTMMIMATASRGAMGPPPPRLHHQHQQREAPHHLNVIVTVNNEDDDDELKREGGGLTPGLHSVDRVAINGHRSAPRMFPIFRSKKDLKTLYIVRHGESEYNAAISRAGSAWADPQIFDAPLTDRGRRQAAALQAKFASLGVPHHEVLWVTSPLTRAIQTLLLACPVSHMFGNGENGCGGGVGSTIMGSGNSIHNHHQPQQQQRQQQEGSSSIAPIAHVLPCLTEKVFTTGDVGRHPTALADDFPSLAPQLLALPQTWWYTRSDKPNCGIQRKQLSNEPNDVVQKRIAEFKRWALERPEKVIVAVGHSSYWKTFAKLLGDGSVDSMRNCEVRQLYL
jgi:broad specificity phosphatase PhoE